MTSRGTHIVRMVASFTSVATVATTTPPRTRSCSQQIAVPLCRVRCESPRQADMPFAADESVSKVSRKPTEPHT